MLEFLQRKKRNMKLNEWLFKKHISKTEFAQIIGCSRSYLHHIMSGFRPLTKRMMVRIIEATEGEVKVKDMSKKRKK